MIKKIIPFAYQAFIDYEELFRHTFSKDNTVSLSKEVLDSINFPQLLKFIKDNRPNFLTMAEFVVYKAYFQNKFYGLIYSRDRVYVYHYNFELKDDKYYIVSTNKGELYLLPGNKLSVTSEVDKFEIDSLINNNVFLLDCSTLPEHSGKITTIGSAYDFTKGIDVETVNKIKNQTVTLSIGEVVKVTNGLEYALGYLYLYSSNKIACYTNGKFYEVVEIDDDGIAVIGQETDRKKLHYDLKESILLNQKPVTPREITKLYTVLKYYKQISLEFLKYLLEELQTEYEVELAMKSFNYGVNFSKTVSIQ